MNNINKEKINKWKTLKYAICFFFLMRIFTPDFIKNNFIVDNIYILCSELLTVGSVLYFLYVISKSRHCYLKDFSLVLLVAVYFFYYFFITFFMNGNLRRVIMISYPIIGSLCFIHNNYKLHYKELVKGISWMMNMFLLINLIDMLLIKKVLSTGNTNYMVGGKNQLSIFLVISLVFWFADRSNIYQKINIGIKDVVYLFLVLITTLISKSSTCLLTVLLIFAIFAWGELKNGNLKFNIKIITLVYVIAWFSLIIFRLQHFFSDFILNVLHKDLTFSHRTIIWDTAIETISKRWLFGYGMQDTVNIFSVNHDYTGGQNDVWTAISAHNEILQLLYYGGTILVIIFIAIYFVCLKNKNSNNKHFYLFFLGVLAILITWLSEVPGEYAMFFMLSMCYYSKRSVDNGSNKYARTN